MPGGRPPIYSQELADQVCLRLSKGESLRRITADDDMPSAATVWKWIDTIPGFATQYARARELQAEALADEIVDIADSATDIASSAAARLRVDARKWVAAKLLPKRYGERILQEHTGADGGPIRMVRNDLIAFQKPLPPKQAEPPAEGDDAAAGDPG